MGHAFSFMAGVCSSLILFYENPAWVLGAGVFLVLGWIYEETRKN